MGQKAGPLPPGQSGAPQEPPRTEASRSPPRPSASLVPALRPWNEKARLEALRSYEVLDTPPEQSFDDITQLAAQLCDAPIALVALADEQRVWFKSRVGVDVAEVARDTSFCAHAILQSSLLIVPDLLADARLATPRREEAALPVRFYMGAPLITPEGFTLGTVCVMDPVPREPRPQQARALEALARQVVGQLELRRMNRSQTRFIDELRATNERFEVILRATNDIIWDWDIPAGKVSWNERVQDILGHPVGAGTQDSSWWYNLVHPDDRDRVADGFRKAVAGGAVHWTDEYRVRRANGTYARVLDRGSILRNARGVPLRILGTVMDMSEREEMRARLALADRMASVGTLAAGVAHEINNPLAYVIANLDYARQEVEAAAAGRRRPRRWSMPRRARARRARAPSGCGIIVQDLKTFSRPDDERQEAVDLRRAHRLGGDAGVERDPPPRAAGEGLRAGARGVRQRGPAGAGVPQPAGERGARHPRGRGGPARNPRHPRGWTRRAAWSPRCRTRARASPRSIRPRMLEPVLHHQAPGRGHGAGAVHLPRHRHQPGRRAPVRERAGPGHDVPRGAHPADGRGAGGRSAEKKAVETAKPGRHAGGGRRAAGAQRDEAHAEPGARGAALQPRAGGAGVAGAGRAVGPHPV